MIEHSDSTALLAAYEAKLSEAIERLGPPDDGNVWLYRAEHLRDVPVDQINTERYTPAQIATLEEARGRWFGDDLAVRFQHMFRYVQTEPHEGVENIRLSAVQVPLAVAAHCYLGGKEARDIPWEDMTPLERARSTTNEHRAQDEYFFPPRLTAADLGTDKTAVSLATDYNRTLAELESRKQPLCEIPLQDYLRASPEAWHELGQHLDAVHDTAQTRTDVTNFLAQPTVSRVISRLM